MNGHRSPCCPVSGNLMGARWKEQKCITGLLAGTRDFRRHSTVITEAGGGLAVQFRQDGGAGGDKLPGFSEQRLMERESRSLIRTRDHPAGPGAGEAQGAGEGLWLGLSCVQRCCADHSSAVSTSSKVSILTTARSFEPQFSWGEEHGRAWAGCSFQRGLTGDSVRPRLTVFTFQGNGGSGGHDGGVSWAGTQVPVLTTHSLARRGQGDIPRKSFPWPGGRGFTQGPGGNRGPGGAHDAEGMGALPGTHRNG